MLSDPTLAAARAGDAAGFERLVTPYRRELHVHCYRLTGSLSDAEDLVQESLLRAWKALGTFEGRSSLRTWLYRIATNACLNALDQRAPRALPSQRGDPGDPMLPPAEPTGEPLWLDPCPEDFGAAGPLGPDVCVSARESVGLAFLSALQNLAPLQRAVLILRDVLGWSAAEVADLLDSTVAAVNSALQRARATLEARQDRLDSGAFLGPDDARTRDLVRRYVAAWESGDAAALSKLLREDALLTMPPVPTWFRGSEDIRAFLAPMLGAMGSFCLRPLVASGAPAVAAWLRAPGDPTYRAQSLHVLQVSAAGVSRMDVFMNPSVFKHFGLPQEL